MLILQKFPERNKNIFCCRFLFQTCPAANGVEEGGLDSLADLVLDLASVIVERSGLLPALLPGPAPGHLAAIPGPVQVTYPRLSLVFLPSILNSDWCRRRLTRPCCGCSTCTCCWSGSRTETSTGQRVR